MLISKKERKDIRTRLILLEDSVSMIGEKVRNIELNLRGNNEAIYRGAGLHETSFLRSLDMQISLLMEHFGVTAVCKLIDDPSYKAPPIPKRYAWHLEKAKKIKSPKTKKN